MHRPLALLEPGGRIGSRDQPPAPQQIVQLPVSVHLPGRLRRRLVILSQELIMEPLRQDTQDVDRVIRVGLVHRLRAHTYGRYQRHPTEAEDARTIAG
jgi:hypothetical protein